LPLAAWQDQHVSLPQAEIARNEFVAISRMLEIVDHLMHKCSLYLSFKTARNALGIG